MILLSGCSTTPDKSVNDIILDAVRDQAIEEGNETTLAETPEHYIKLASKSRGEMQQRYLVKAAELLYSRGDIASAQDQLESIQAEDIAGSRHIQIQLLAAKIALANHNPAQAIDLLPGQERLTVSQFIEINEIRAEANVAMGYLLAAIKTRVEIDPYYKDNEKREKNHRAIWSALNALSPVVLNDISSSNKALQGWLELIRVMRAAQLNSNELRNEVLDWSMRFPEHPVGNTLIERLLQAHLGTPSTDHVIAVLLPQQGPYQAVTKAIKNGFLSAYYADRTQSPKPVLRFYDTSRKDLDFVALYRKVVQEGADYVLGPLDKAAIDQLMLSNDLASELEVPVLTLNYAEDASSVADNLYQFGLLPEDEARQVAELAIRRNKTRAAILAPDGPWGERLKSAFEQRFTELGGSVLSTQHFNGNIDDYGRPIKQLLNLQQSNNRHKDLQHLLGTELKYSPYRRQDIDMVFLAATHHSARSIMPALKFHHAGDLPVYSTSHVYTGNKDRSADMDLNGLMFCDLPWTLLGDHSLKQTFKNNWPEQQNYTRLFALGIDSYHLLYNLKLLSSYENAQFVGQTGNIYLDSNNRLHRESLWARFQNGTARYINTTIAPKSGISIESD
ncbi:MAG: penicillin-binding protein activator [Gammaproteobacteria bacterium]|nr:penicillin-binding protein activator [Gammaproteobacteria bacterium]